MMPDILTLAQAAEALGVHPDSLRRQVRLGKLVAQKIGRDWVVTQGEMERYRRENLGRAGRPPRIDPRP